MNRPTNEFDGINQLIDDTGLLFNTVNSSNMFVYTAFYTPKDHEMNRYLPSHQTKSRVSTTFVRNSADSLTRTTASAEASPATSLQTMASTSQSVTGGTLLPVMTGLSALVYGSGDIFHSAPLPKKGSNVVANGVSYQVVDVEDDPSGYEGMTLWDQVSKSIVVVNRGTQSVADVWSDAKMAFQTVSNQWQGAMALGSRVAALATQRGATSIYCAGHSLGGTLTQMQAAYFGWTGYTFNAYGADQIYNQLGLTISSSAQVYNYRTLFDLVSDASTQIGYTPVNVETPQDAALLSIFFSTGQVNGYDLLITAGKDHGIANFIAGGNTGNLSSADNVFNLVPGFGAPLAPQTISMAQDMVASVGELIHLFFQSSLQTQFQSGNLSWQQTAQEVLEFINNEPASGIQAVVPSDIFLLSNALNASSANNAYRASLEALSPVVLQGDPSAFASATLWQPGQTTGLTVDYLTARNDMIRAMIASAGQGQQIGGAINTNNENSYVYSDLSLSPSPMYTVNGKGGATYDVVFADNNGDVLTGSSGANLELFGGTGNDTLYGGTANDTLEGAGGKDEYDINGSGTGTDYILDTDGSGSIVWKFMDGSSETLNGGNDEPNTPYWKSSDEKLRYVEILSKDGSTELEVTAGNKTIDIDDFTNGEFGINLNTGSSEPTGSSNLSLLNDEGLVGDTTPGGNAQHVYEDNASGGAVQAIYGVDSSGNAFGNEIIGDGKANFISAGNGNNYVILGGFFNHATDPTAVALNAVIEGGSGNQVLIGVGNGAETITGGGLGSDTTALTAIDGGGAQADLQGGGQNSVVFGGTGADTLEASTAINPSNSGFNPESDLFAGLSFWGDAYSTVDGSSGNYYLGSLPQVTWTLSSPNNLQVELSLFQSNDTYAAPFELLGSSLDSGSPGSSTLPGSLLIGGSGTDLLVGNSGNDTIMGGQPGNPVNGKTDEVLVGGAGADLIYGGSGSVVIYADMSAGAVSGWASLDPNNADTIYAGTGNDFIYGSGGKDVIYGGAGNDVIYTGNGATYIDSGSGNSSIYGGTGNDTITAKGTSSTIQTGDGNTYVDLVNGTSSVTAGAGQDTIDSDGGNAVITGGSGLLTVVVQSNGGDETIQSGTGGTLLALTDGLTESSIVVRDVNGDLVITDPGFEAAITVSGYFGASNGISLQFADGTTWGASQISQASMTASPYGGNDTLIGSSGSDSISAGFGDTSIVGVSGDNTLIGGAGNDTIDGGAGADTIEGGSGTTLINGGTGKETYLYQLGDGPDTIVENTTAAGNDIIIFGAGIGASDLSFVYDSSTNVALVTVTSTGETITVANFVATQTSQHQITALDFADGSSLSQLQVIQQAWAIYGTTGNDSVIGTSSANYFDGKGGNDIEVGNGGNDSFVFNSGYGHLEINEGYTSGQTPVLLLGAGIAASSLHISANGYNAILTDGVAGDQVTLDGMLRSSTNGVAIAQFADGTTLSASQILQDLQTGTAGSDTLYGTTGADLLDGKGGNDLEIGNGGNDTFVFNQSYGQLEINEAYSSDQQPVLQLGPEIKASALKVTVSGNSLVLTDGINGDQITLDNANLSNGYGVAVVQLADGTTFTASQLIQMSKEISGTSGNDTLYGTGGADLIDGKGGNDVEYGEDGNDTFVFDAGYGQLAVDETDYSGGQISVLQLGSGIATSSLHVSTDGADLFLTDGIAGDEIDIESMWSNGTVYGVSEVQLADGTTLTAAQLRLMEATGTTGSDTIYGTAGGSLIDGKGGGDYEIGSGGSDTFVFNAGYGHLAINETYATGQLPILRLGAGITEASLRVTADSSNNLILTDGINGDQVGMNQMWYSILHGTGNYGVQAVQLADGTTLSLAQLTQMEVASGTTGNDTIYGTSGADLIDGKGGNDSVVGNGGNDTFVFNAGYGQLTINNRYASSDVPVLQLGAGITESALTVLSDGDNLYLTDGDPGDKIVLDGMSGYTGYGVQAIKFADGTTLTGAQLNQMAGNYIFGTSGSDTLGTSDSTPNGDYIDGNGGSDLEVTSGGNDTFVFKAGYGQLEISGSSYANWTAHVDPNPVLLLGAGIAASDLHVSTNYQGYYETSVYLTDGVSGDQITLYDMGSQFSGSGSPTVQLADGESLSMAQLIWASLPQGTTGNDTITGTWGGELIDGKGGADSVNGEGGNDTFVFKAGYGRLSIQENYSAGQQPVLQLGAGITMADLHVTSNDNDLFITDGTAGDQITLDNMFSNNSYGVARLQLADGTSLTATQLFQMEMTGTTGDDTLYCLPGAYLVDGKGGNDVEYGEGGNDTFIYNAGYGDLEINNGSITGQQAVLQLGVGITASALRVTSDGMGGLILADGISGDKITLDNELYQNSGVQLVAFADGTTLTAAQLDKMEMTGTTSGDTLYGTYGSDLIDGKGGGDSVVGNGGSDTFAFNAGYGRLEIDESYITGTDQPVLQLGTGITVSALHVTDSGNNVIVTDGISGDQITLDNMWSAPGTGVAMVQFYDGTTLTAAQLIQLEMTGTTGNDTIIGTSGADLIDGKGGSDSVTGGGGNDTFVFNSGYGHLTINEAYKSGQVPVLKLDAGITASALRATKSGNNLVLTDGVSGDQITLVNMWSTSTAGVASLQLSNGTTLTRSQIIALEMTGTTGNDTITGTSGADLIDGKGGTDSVTGGGGSDTFVFNSGYGKLTINEVYTSGQAPVLKLGAGITSSTLHVAQSSNNMVLTDGVSGDQITLIGMWTTSTDGVATVQFSDGTTLSRSQLLTKGAAVKSAQRSSLASSMDAVDDAPQGSPSTASGNEFPISTAATSSGAALPTAGDAIHTQVNAMIHAMASFTGMNGSDAGQLGHPISPVTMPGVMLHSAA